MKQQPIPTPISPVDLNRWLQQPEGIPICVDVREEQELQVASFSSSVVHLPLSESSNWMNNIAEIVPSGTSIVVICHLGLRSFNFGSWLLQQELGHQVWNLEGGIDAWSVAVDQSIPRY